MEKECVYILWEDFRQVEGDHVICGVVKSEVEAEKWKKSRDDRYYTTEWFETIDEILDKDYDNEGNLKWKK